MRTLKENLHTYFVNENKHEVLSFYKHFGVWKINKKNLVGKAIQINLIINSTFAQELMKSEQIGHIEMFEKTSWKKWKLYQNLIKKLLKVMEERKKVPN